LVGRAGEGNKQKDIFFHYELRVRKIQKWYERMLLATDADSPSKQAAALHANPPTDHQRVSPPQSRGPYKAPAPASTSGVPVSATFSHQQPQHYAQSMPYQHQPMPATHHQPMPPRVPPHISPQPSLDVIGMTPMSSYSSYSPVPSVAYPDLMNANGWDNMFSIPMEQELIFDVSQGYGLGIASPPSEASWDSSSAQ
jgi:hypothetical protein